MPLRVLLLHEYSGVHTELKAGLRELGVSADIATFGDYHKAFATDLDLGRVDPGLRHSAGRAIRQIINVAAFRRYDIVQSISALPFNRAVSRLVEPLILGTRGPRYVFVAAGSDSFYRRHCLSLDYWPPHDWHHRARVERMETRIARRASAIVSALWDYDYTMRKAGFEPEFIPLPVHVGDIAPVRIAERERLVVYHPLNRKEGNDFKGTTHIRRAFEMLRAEYEGSVDFIERGGMSFDEYSRFTDGVDVIVDQANSYTYGMSALYGLAKGQVVLSGNEPVTHELAAYRQSPVVNIRPDAEQIADTLRRLLSDRAALQARGAEGRAFVERVHDTRIVARQYLDLYERILSAPR